MARNKEMAQVMKVLERMSARMDESKKMMEFMAITLQIIVKHTPNKDGETLPMKKVKFMEKEK